MLKLHLPEKQFFNEDTSQFFMAPAISLEFEHSLVTLSKWESRFEKAFLGDDPKTEAEVIEYIRMMCTTPISDAVLARFGNEEMTALQTYIQSKQTATWFSERPGGASAARGRKETVTSELVYYWMIAYNIPFECQHWHFNRLQTLIEICNRKNEKPQKQSKASLAQSRRELNAQRRAATGSTG